MQKKTRYVNVSIGIGGWQPFDAATVDKTSYGDCKALSNFTKSLLSVVGIKSFYALNNAGSDANSIDRSFPSAQFNHAFVCVPLDRDTIWLECTNQRYPCGFNSDFTDAVLSAFLNRDTDIKIFLSIIINPIIHLYIQIAVFKIETLDAL